jgi:hypothetical protein
MKDQTLRVEYYAVTTEDKPGVGADIGKRLTQEHVNLLALQAFPIGPGKIQVDFVPENPEQFSKAARKLGLSIGLPKTAFLVQGTDRVGALGETLDRLGSQGINVRATCGVACGGNRYGAILWVAPADVEKAARALGAQTVTHKV